jgi:mycothiol synthase
MLRPNLDDLPPLVPALAALPSGYGFRTYRPGDEAAWADIVKTGEMGPWDADTARAKLTGAPYPQFDPGGLYFVTYGPGGPAARPVGTACAWLAAPEERETGILHMVVVRPEYRGRRLSYPLCLAVLHRFRERGYRRVRLNTNDWRLGAVKVYLELGFRPWVLHPLHPQQWDAVVRQLGWTAPLEPIVELAATATTDAAVRP